MRSRILPYLIALLICLGAVAIAWVYWATRQGIVYGQWRCFAIGPACLLWDGQ